MTKKNKQSLVTSSTNHSKTTKTSIEIENDTINFARIVGLIFTLGSSVPFYRKLHLDFDNMQYYDVIISSLIVVFAIMIGVFSFEAYSFKIYNQEDRISIRKKDSIKIAMAIILFSYTMAVLLSSRIDENSYFIFLILPLLFFLLSLSIKSEYKYAPCNTVRSVKYFIYKIERVLNILYVIVLYVFIFFVLKNIVDAKAIYFIFGLTAIASSLLLIIIVKYMILFKFITYSRKGKVECKI